MSVSTIAVDVVLIPPDDVVQFAIDLNRTLPETVAENYVQDAKTCIPHVTLLMGLISRNQILDVSRKLELIRDKFSPINLNITHAKNSVASDGKVVSGLEIEKTAELQRLHEAALSELGSIFSYDNVETGMFYAPPPVRQVPRFWAEGLAKTRVREKYHPHITLGVGRLTEDVSPFRFTASRIALCHLGTYSTCRKVLWESTLLKP